MTADLRNKLADLHAELGRTSSVDPQSRELLIGLLDDITRLLGGDDRTAVDQQEPRLDERLDSLAIRFETEHPALGTALRRVIDALAKAGI